MPGFSLTLLLLPSSSSTAAPPEDVILRLLDASTSAPGWKWSSGAPPSALSPSPAVVASERTIDRVAKVRAQDVQGFARGVERICNALHKAEPEITRMDTISGDGDCGLTLQTGAQGMRIPRNIVFSLRVLFVHPAVLARLRAGSITGEDVVGTLIAVSEVASEKMGGTSGALYSWVSLSTPFYDCSY